jgi:molecular chaperone GrpE
MQTEESLDQEPKDDAPIPEMEDNQDTTESSQEETVEMIEKTPEEMVQDEKDRYIRLYSEFDNYKRRTAKERLEFAGMANKDMMLALLPVVDDFERAMATIESLSDEGKKAMEGMDLIHKKLWHTLNNKGLKPMDAQGKDFDVEYHEAITKIPVDNDLKGKVVDVVEKGYLLNDAILRYAKVVVGE